MPGTSKSPSLCQGVYVCVLGQTLNLAVYNSGLAFSSCLHGASTLTRGERLGPSPGHVDWFVHQMASRPQECIGTFQSLLWTSHSPNFLFSFWAVSSLFHNCDPSSYQPTMLNSHYWFSFFKQMFQEKAFTVSKLWMRSNKDKPREWEFPGASEKVKLCNSLGVGLFQESQTCLFSPVVARWLGCTATMLWGCRFSELP